MNSHAQTAEKPAVMGARLGLYAGLASMIFFIALYIVNPLYLISPMILLGFVIIVLFKVGASYLFWKSRKGDVEFKAALQSVFMVSVVALAMSVLFFWLMFHVIDPSLPDQMKSNIGENAVKAFDEGRITKDQMDAALEKAEKFNLGASAFFAMYSFTLFIGFFYALVFAGITKLITRDIARTREIYN